jgi:valyl-tRNA synthetase
VTTVTIIPPSAPAPTGCAVYTVGSIATVYLYVKGRIDIDKEITKAKDRLAKATEIVEKQKKTMDEKWEEKASEAVKEMEREKLKAAEVEGRNWQASIEQFMALKIE